MDYNIRVCYNKHFFLKNIFNHFGAWWQNNQVLKWVYNANTLREIALVINSPYSTPTIFRVCHWYASLFAIAMVARWIHQPVSLVCNLAICVQNTNMTINGHRESNFQVKLEFLGFKNISLVMKGIRGTNIVPHRAKFMVSTTISI